MANSRLGAVLKMKSFIAILVVISAVAAVEFQIKNNVSGTIWVGIMGKNGKPPLEGGGFVLNQNEERSVYSAEDWEGRFWARTWCDGKSKHCLTGDCGNKLECRGNGGVPPATLIEITLKGPGAEDFYDVSLADGFNVMGSIEPLGGSGSCKAVRCAKDLNVNCPDDLKLWGPAGYAIGCHSSCNKFNTDEYCCRGAFGTPQTCSTNNWSVNSARYFKNGCPDAYSYTYDDKTSTFSCVAPAYRVTFG